MSKAKLLAGAAGLFIAIIAMANWPFSQKKETQSVTLNQPIEIQIPAVLETVITEVIAEPEAPPISEPARIASLSDDRVLPAEVNLIPQLFQPYPPNLPFIETLSFASKVDWVTGRVAYLGDYASYYHTSKHFISRSLHGTGSYLSDRVSKGDRFNVYRKDYPIEFHLVLDLSRLKLWLYCYDKTKEAKILLKSYPVCAGRIDVHKASGSLTPLGLFAIGHDCAVYEEGIRGIYKNESREMISVYGKRWIPIGREIAQCTGSSRGLGLQGVPWKRDLETGRLKESRESIGHYESGGCIRLLTEDIEELYAIIASKPAYIHIVKDFIEAHVPGKDLVF